MNCYVCLVSSSGEQKAACAICQRCGAGLCEKHLITHCSTSPMGMGGNGNPRYLLVCQRCSPDRGGMVQSPQPALSQYRPKLVSHRHWWQRVQRKQPDLPDSQEAIAGVEQFLKKQRRQKESPQEGE